MHSCCGTRRVQVVYLMQSFAGQGKGVGSKIVHALRQGGISSQNPTHQIPASLSGHLQPADAAEEPQQLAVAAQAAADMQGTELERLTNIQILQQLLDERSGKGPMHSQREQVNQVSRSSTTSTHTHHGLGGGAREFNNNRQLWLVLADAPMENARPFWHKMVSLCQRLASLAFDLTAILISRLDVPPS